MARKSRKAEQLKQEIISSVPVEQRKMITQPITFTYLNGEMSMMQTRIQTTIMEKLQDKIKRALARKVHDGMVGDLFDTEDYKPISPDDRSKYLTFKVAYSELGIEPQHYNDVDVAAKSMQSIVYEKEVDGKMRYTVAFPVIDIDKDIPGKRRQNIYLHMTESTAKDLFRITPYHRYLKDAIFLFSSNYAGRIYLLINANKQLGTWVIPYDKLRKILLTTYDKESGKVSVDKYKDINDFKKRVLEPARREIQEAADRIDCTFDYEFQYPAGKKRGTPENIVFHIHLTDLGRNIRQTQLESHQAARQRKANDAVKAAEPVVVDTVATEVTDMEMFG
jgi:ArsR family metal-binding transcriptional regulator